MSAKKYDHIIETIGNTPIVKLRTFSKMKGKFYAKIEAFNPGRSSKDRIGISIIEEAEKEGLLNPGSTIIEATSGNTGLGLALVAIERGYKVILVMPDKMSPDKMVLVNALGCEVHVTPTEVEPDDPRSYYSVSKRLAEEIPNSFYANQYNNPANPLAHYKTTGPEIWEQTEGKITHYICGVGTGGTISGAGKYLKEKNPKIKVIGIDPLGSILAHYHKYRTTEGIVPKGYKVEGVGEDIIPENVDFDMIDEFITVNDQVSFDWTSKIAKAEGILVGPSSGMVLAGAMEYAKSIDDENTFAVLLLPDTGERYLGRAFSKPWMRSHGFIPPVEKIEDILGSKSANLPPIISLNEDNTLQEALDKIIKFRIELILIETASGLKYLTNYDIYDHLLLEKPTSENLSSFDLKDVNSLDINASFSELKKAAISHNQVIITKNEKVIGLITKEDIINNLQF